MTKILYLHGFASAADSTKANLIDSYIKKNSRSTKILIPDLDNDVENAYHQIDEIIKLESPSSIIGSSLGGFYATYFSEKYELLCVNINPAVPPIDMSDYLGENQNYSTGEKFIINKDHLKLLGKMSKKIKVLKRPENFLTLIQSGDEILDYKLAIKYFAASQIEIKFGGNHSFEGFEDYFYKNKNISNYALIKCNY